MNANLTKYLSEVFRNELPAKTVPNQNEHINFTSHPLDQKINQFIVDRKFSLRLDEII